MMVYKNFVNLLINFKLGALSSPHPRGGWAILPFLGLSKGRLVSLLRVALGRASHRDTKTRRQETGRRGFVLWERRGPPRPLCSAMPTENWSPLAPRPSPLAPRPSPLAPRHISSTHSIHAVSWRSPSRSPACGESLSRRHTRHGEKFSPGPPTSSSASAILSDDSTATPRNPVRQNAGPIRAFA